MRDAPLGARFLLRAHSRDRRPARDWCLGPSYVGCLLSSVGESEPTLANCSMVRCSHRGRSLGRSRAVCLVAPTRGPESPDGKRPACSHRAISLEWFEAIVVRAGTLWTSAVGSIDDLACERSEINSGKRLEASDTERAASGSARGRSHHSAGCSHASEAGYPDETARHRAAAPDRRPRDPTMRPVRDVPSGIHLGAAINESHLVRHGCAGCFGAHRTSRRTAAELRRKWSYFRCRQRHSLSRRKY